MLQKLSLPLFLCIAVFTRKCFVQCSERCGCAGGLFGVAWEGKFDIKMLGINSVFFQVSLLLETQ